MNKGQNEEWYLDKAKNEIQDNKLDDAELTLREGQYKYPSSYRITSLLSYVFEPQAQSKETPMADSTRNYKNYNPDLTEKKEETISEKENRMMRNVFIMRSRILSMQVKVAVDKIQTLKYFDRILETTNDTENSREKAERAFFQNKYVIADTFILKAEQLYSKMAANLFPAKPKKDEKPSEEYLRMKRNKTSSNHAGVTVRGNKEDVVACIDKAKEAFAANDLEKARNWLNKSQRILYTVNAKELLAEVQNAIAARDTPKDIPNVNPEASPDDDNTNSVVDPNPEQARTQTPTEPPSGSGRIIHNENVEGATKCLDNANKAFKEGNLDKAERFLLKAKRMDSSIDVEQYLKQVNDAKAKNKTLGENAVSEQEPRESENPEQIKLQIDEANTYLQIAKNALKDKKYDRALIFLDKSEALYTSESSKTLRKQIQDAKSKPKKSVVERLTIFFTGEEPSKPTRKEELDKLIIAIRNDIDTGNLDEAERKLLTPGFVKCVQLKGLRIEVNEKKALRTIEDKPKIEESNPEPVHQSEPLRNEMLSDIRPEQAETCIEVAEKAYYDGNLDKAERLLKKAERLHPTDRAKKLLKTVYTAKEEKERLDNEKPKLNENESARASVEHATETIVPNEVQMLINDGLKDMENEYYCTAECVFRQAKHLEPSNKLIDALLADVQTKRKMNATSGTNTLSTPDPESMGTRNRQNEKPTDKFILIEAANKYTDRAQAAYNCGDIEKAETFIKLPELFNSTEHTRELFVLILRAKYGVQDEGSDDDDVATFQVVDHSRKKKTYSETINKGKDYLKSAEESFIKGDFKEAKNFIFKSEIPCNRYVYKMTEKIKHALNRNSRWY